MIMKCEIYQYHLDTTSPTGPTGPIIMLRGDFTFTFNLILKTFRFVFVLILNSNLNAFHLVLFVMYFSFVLFSNQINFNFDFLIKNRIKPNIYIPGGRGLPQRREASVQIIGCHCAPHGNLANRWLTSSRFYAVMAESCQYGGQTSPTMFYLITKFKRLTKPGLCLFSQNSQTT